MRDWLRVRKSAKSVLFNLANFLSIMVCLLLEFTILLLSVLNYFLLCQTRILCVCSRTKTQTCTHLYVHALSFFVAPHLFLRSQQKESHSTHHSQLFGIPPVLIRVGHQLRSVSNNSPEEHSMILSHTDTRHGADQP